MSKSILLVVCSVVLMSSYEARAQQAGSCTVFPADNPWNQDITTLPIHPQSATWVAKINSSKTTLHPDWGSTRIYGIPYCYVGANQPLVNITFEAGNSYPDESDKGPWPIPPTAMVEGDSTDTQYEDFHVIIIDTDHCVLYELYHAKKDAMGTGWTVWSAAKFDLNTDYYRPDGWTSADAAGLPIFPGLVRWDEVQAGEIKHAVRFTAPTTQRGWIHPARHMAGKTSDTTYPPMGARFRLQADYSEAGFTGGALVILKALKKYGMILADNGSAWFITGCHDDRWDDESIGQLKNIPGSAFDAVYTGPVKHSPDQSSMIGINKKDITFDVATPGTYYDSLTISNYGNQALTISSITTSDPAIKCGTISSVASGNAASIWISAAITSQHNAKGTIVIVSNDPLQPSDTINITMNISGGATQSAIALDKDSVAFDIGSGVHGMYSDTIHISNSGTAALTISNISATDPSITETVPANIAAGTSGLFIVHANMTTQHNVNARIFFSTNAPQHLKDTVKVFLNIPSVGVDEQAPKQFSIHSYPTPMVSSPATIEYLMDRADNVSLKLFSPLGSEISTLVNGHTEVGRHTSEIRTADLPNGMYMYRLVAGSRMLSGKLIVAH